jgi:hypothetical protein
VVAFFIAGDGRFRIQFAGDRLEQRPRALREPALQLGDLFLMPVDFCCSGRPVRPRSIQSRWNHSAFFGLWPVM